MSKEEDLRVEMSGLLSLCVWFRYVPVRLPYHVVDGVSVDNSSARYIH